MSPFEILYGRQCNTPISRCVPIDRLMLGPDLLEHMELTVKPVQQNLKTSQDKHKSYADLKRTPREFEVGDHVYIKVKLNKSTLILGKYKKLETRYGKAFEILAKLGPVAYKLVLPPNIKVYNVSFVSLLKRYVHDVSHVIEWNEIQVEPEGEFQIGPEHILDRRELLLRNHTIGQMKVQWKHLSPEEDNWELESNIQEAYPILF